MQPISAAQFESLFETRLADYDVDHDTVNAEQEEQDQLVARLKEANNKFLSARQADVNSSSGPVKAREQALQELENGYVKYKEIINNLDTGRKFYNDLAGHVSRFRDQCQKQVAARRMEKSEMEAELLSGDVGRLNLQETRRELRSEKARQAKQGNENVDLPGAEPLTAPMPTKPGPGPASAVAKAVGSPVSNGTPGVSSGGIWTPSMGIRFGDVSSLANGGYPQPRRPN